MAMGGQSSENSRFTDLIDEPVDRLLSPIRGYEEKSLLPLTEAVKPISGFFDEIQDYVYVALHNCQNPPDELDQQESASIHLYTMQFHGGPSLYHSLNQSLRAENRDELIPWFSFLKLFLTALHKLPSHSKIVWRGVRDVDLSLKYKTGTKFAWWGVSSCTIDIEVLKSNQFLGKIGQRTLFSIECINGKSVASHSYFKNTEKEIILMPGSYFEVVGHLDSGNQLHIIQLQEIPPPITLLRLPFTKPSSVNPPSVINKPYTDSQPKPKLQTFSISSKADSTPKQPSMDYLDFLSLVLRRFILLFFRKTSERVDKNNFGRRMIQ
jgi:hypothetical protein